MERHTNGSTHSPRLVVEWLTDLGQIRGLREPWLRLQDRVQRRTVYCDHDWIVAWYERYCGSKYTNHGTPLVGAAWEGDRLVGIAPMVKVRGRLARIPVRELLFAGFNLQAGELLTLDGRPEIASELLRSLVQHGKWDIASLTGLQLGWDEVQLLRQAATDLRLPWELTEDDPYAVADLREGYKPYIMKRSGHFRQNLKRYGRKLEAAGGWELDRMPPQASPDQMEGYLERILAIAEEGWRARQRGLEEERSHHPFFQRVFRAFGPRGMLDVTVLKVDGKDAAYCVGLVERNHYYHMVMGFVEALRNLSPSAFMLQEILKRLSEQGVSSVVSHGDYDYKRHWASAFVPQKRLLIFGRGPLSQLSYFVKFKVLPRLGWLHPAGAG